MRLPLDMLSKLPRYLLVTSLALAVGSLPVDSAEVELKVLTPDDFNSTVASGVWLVEHFSPYCGHCKAFLPTWEKLVQTYDAMSSPGIHLAQVNCAINGDLCNEHKVTGYPQMNMYKSGECVDKFTGARDWDRLVAFIDKYRSRDESDAKLQATEQVKVVQPPSGSQEQTEDTRLPTPQPPPNQNGLVKPLNPSNFAEVLDNGLVFVKFFAPWCGHCKKLAPTWTRLASYMRQRLTIAEVNCDDHPALCKSQDVPGYPALYFYTGGSGRGMHKTEYTGGRKFEQLRDFVETATAPSVSEIGPADYEHFVKEQSVVYLFLQPASAKLAYDQLSQTAHILLGSPKVLTSSAPEIRSRFSLPDSVISTPVLLAIKDGVPNEYTSLFTFPSGREPADDAALSQWLLSNRLPTATELNQDTFQPVMNALHRPLVVIAAVPGEEGKAGYAESMKEAALAWRSRRERLTSVERDVVFTWMDAKKWESWMKSMYAVKQRSLPIVLIADHQQLIYYDTLPDGSKIQMNTASILAAVEGVLSGKTRVKHSENIVERLARYLNDSLTGLERAITAHPYRTGFFFFGLLLGFVAIIRRFIASDLPSHPHEYKLQKSPNRLD